jgi:hypothetical protein
VTLLRIFTGESKGSFAQGLFSRNLHTAAASCQKRRFPEGVTAMTWVAFRALFPATFVFIFGPASRRGPDSQLLYFRERQCCSYRFRSSHEAGGHGLVPACRSFNRGPPAPSSHSFLPGMLVLCTSGRLWIWPGVGGQSSPYTVSLLRRPQSLETRYTCLPSEDHAISQQRVSNPLRQTWRGHQCQFHVIPRSAIAGCAAVAATSAVNEQMTPGRKGSKSCLVLRRVKCSCLMTHTDHVLVNVISRNAGDCNVIQV